MRTTREQVWKQLWTDPKYLRLHARKDKIAKAWNTADAYKQPEAAELSKRLTRANKAIQKYEDTKLTAASA